MHGGDAALPSRNRQPRRRRAIALHHRLLVGAARLVWRVTKPRTVGVRAVLLDPDDRIALIRHTYAEHWYLPGGGVKKGESAETALHRELAEEVAVDGAAVDRILGVYHSRLEGKDDHVIVFVARVSAEAAAGLRRADALEVAEAAWFPLDALPAATSPATRRRIDELRRGATGLGAW
ncbi:NUDIX domain-containing protein [Sphingomonas sp. ac-8]|uniref:NUDIX domain-containing protein n=1 Tax=Sphingomonas sp. ac-8 TaxID=3242977 RepID=UPI003A805614